MPSRRLWRLDAPLVGNMGIMLHKNIDWEGISIGYIPGQRDV